MLAIKKKIVILSGILLVCSSFATFPLCKKHNVYGTVMKVKSYCGGAKMPDERYAEYIKPKVFINKKIYVKKGRYNDFKKNTIIEVITDSSGNFSFALPVGIYCIVDEYKKDKTNYTTLLSERKSETKNYSAISESCLKEWFQTPDAVFEVKKVMDKLTVTFQEKCAWNKIPCVTYKGPKPG